MDFGCEQECSVHGGLIPESPLGRCVAIITAANLGDYGLVLKLLEEAREHRLTEAMSALASVLYSALCAAIGEDNGSSFLTQIGLASVAMDEEIFAMAGGR